MELKNKVVIVTGASSGIGKQIAIKLAEEEAKVVLLARSKEKLKELEEAIETTGGEALVVETDVTKQKDIENAVKETIKKYKTVNILINVAGLGIFENVEDMKPEDFDKHIDVMLKGTFLLTKYSLPHIYKNKQGRIVNLTSLWAEKFCAKCSGYTAAKYGVRGFTNSLREEARKYKVGVTNFMPGTVDTPFFDKTDWKTNTSKAIKPENIADTIAFLLKLPDDAIIEEIKMQSVQPPKGE